MTYNKLKLVKLSVAILLIAICLLGTYSVIMYDIESTIDWYKVIVLFVLALILIPENMEET